MAEKKKMSVAEILAAARKADSKQGEAPASEAPASEAPPAAEPQAAEPEAVEAAAAEAPETEAAEAAPAKSAPVAKPGAGGRPSVSDILAAARANKGAAAAPAAKKPAPAAAAKPAPKAAPAEKAAAKAKPAEKEKPVVTTAEKDTASILAGAPKGAKPGPMSKAEAARLNPEGAVRTAAPKNRIVVPPMPPKPDYAKPKATKDAAATEERRGFMSMLFGSFMAVGFTSMSATFGLWTLGTARFMFPNVLTEPPSRFKVGFPSDFAPGYVEEKFKAQFGVWIVNTEYQGKGEIFALRTVCTHLGCTPNWLEGEQKFKCPCHGSGFYKDGINFEGPAPRPLERYSIQLADDGQLEVDKSKLFQEELGQWNDPASFVAV